METGLQAHRRDKFQSETARPTNIRDNQMAKGKHKNPTNGNQGYWAVSEPSSPTTTSPRYPNTQEKKKLDLKSYLMMLIEGVKKEINNSLKEIQENMSQQVEVLQKESQKLLKEIQENKGQQIDHKEETQKSLKKIQENMGQQA